VQEQTKFWGFKGFLPKFHQTCPNKMTSKKTDCISIHVGCIFSNEVPFLPKFHPNLPRFSLTCPKRTIKTWSPKKTTSALHFRYHCCKIEEHIAILLWFHTFRPNFHRFCPYFKGVCPDFHQIKSFGVRLHPRLLHHCLKIKHLWFLKAFSVLVK